MWAMRKDYYVAFVNVIMPHYLRVLLRERLIGVGEEYMQVIVRGASV